MTAEWFNLFSFIKCPLKYWTGISCPGCGMTRAWLSLFTLDIKSAWYYHPLFWLPAAVALLIIFKKRINRKLYNGIMIGFIVLLIGVYVIRLVWGDGNVVSINPEEGMIFKIIDLIRRI